jgi:hypothetical protein
MKMHAPAFHGAKKQLHACFAQPGDEMLRWMSPGRRPIQYIVERCPVLLPGDAFDFCQAGAAIALAHRVSRVVIEIPAGVVPPRVVEMALTDGGSGTRIALAGRMPISLAIATGIATIIAKLVASIRTKVRFDQ